MSKITLALLCSLAAHLALSQTGIKGKVSATSGEILPFSTIYVKGTTNGTTSNASAQYLLKTRAGKQTIVVQYVGYKTVEKQIVIPEGKMIELNFSLEEQVFQLSTVTITSDDENPAHRVIRGAIRKRKFYENEVKAFKSKAYLKGLQRLDDRPDKILGVKVTIDTGIVYLSESVSEFSFERPNKMYERMISSKVSGDDQGFSYNQASDFNVNFYEKTLDLGELSEREFVSPISRQAFFFYDYQLMGTFEENGLLINKIRLLPKRANDPVFDGHIYIVEDSWKIHSVDFLLTKNRGIEFADSIQMNQVFAPAQHGIWMPISQRFSFKFGIFGFKGSGYFIGIYSDYEVEPNYDLYKKEEVYDELVKEEKETDLFNEETFTSEILSVEKGSNKRDSTYWEQIRPLPLTELEVKDYHVKDSIFQVKESVSYKDSVDSEQNKLTLGNILLSGYSHSNTAAEKYWSLPSVTSLFQFNTVEGFVAEFQPTYWKDINEETKYWIRPKLRYGASNKRFNAMVEGSYRKLDDHFTRFYAGGGRYVSQFNENVAITPFINTLTTLIGGDNFMKIFEKSFAYARFSRELTNGIMMDSRIEYASRNGLSNTKTDYSWSKTRNFTPNFPQNIELSDTRLSRHQAFVASVSFRFRFNQKYLSRPDGRILIPSDKPELTFQYKKGFNAFGSDVNFDFLSLKVTDEINLGLFGTSSYAFEVGGFVNNKSLTFVDYHHFAGNETNLRPLDGELQFQLLNFYRFSTSKSYIEGHFEHHFNEFIFNKIPFVRKLNLQAVAGVNYLRTKALGDYFEVGAGIEHIFKFMRVDYWWGFRKGSRISNGLRVGIGF